MLTSVKPWAQLCLLTLAGVFLRLHLSHSRLWLLLSPSGTPGFLSLLGSWGLAHSGCPVQVCLTSTFLRLLLTGFDHKKAGLVATSALL